MSGRLKVINQGKRAKSLNGRQYLALAREAKKARLVVIVPPTIQTPSPEIIPVTIPPPIQYYTCRVCGDNDSLNMVLIFRFQKHRFSSKMNLVYE